MANSFIGRTDLPLGLRNNNPGDLRPGDSWQGMIGTNGGFIVFSDITWGVRALATDLVNAINEGYNTISSLITHFAPPSENDTAGYIASVSSDTTIPADEVLGFDQDTVHSLIRAVMNKELGPSYSAMVSDSDIDTGISMMNSPLTSLLQATGIAVTSAVDNITGNDPTTGSTGSGGLLVGLGLAGLAAWLIMRKK